MLITQLTSAGAAHFVHSTPAAPDSPCWMYPAIVASVPGLLPSPFASCPFTHWTVVQCGWRPLLIRHTLYKVLRVDVCGRKLPKAVNLQYVCAVMPYMPHCGRSGTSCVQRYVPRHGEPLARCSMHYRSSTSKIFYDHRIS